MLMKKYVPVIFLLIFGIFGCMPPQQDNNEKLGTLSYDRLIKRLEVNRMRIKHFIANGNIEIKSNEINQSTNFRIMISRNDSLFMNILGPFNLEVAQILLVKDELKFYETLNNKLYISKINNDAIAKAFKINLPLSQIKELFQGTVNLSQNINRKPLEFKVEDDHYVFRYLSNDSLFTEIYKIKIASLAIYNYQIVETKKQQVVYNANYDDFESINGTPIAKSIEIEDKINNQKIIIKYKNVDINKSKFIIDFDIPQDIEVIRL